MGVPIFTMASPWTGVRGLLLLFELLIGIEFDDGFARSSLKLIDEVHPVFIELVRVGGG